MNSSKKLYIDEIGEILFRKSKRAKKINISIKPFEGIIVSFPYYISYKAAEEATLSKKEWINKNLPKIKRYEGQKIIYTELSNFSTLKHKLIIREKEKGSISVTVRNGKITVKYPEQISVESEEVQQSIKNGIDRALKMEAKEYLPLQVEKLAKRFGFQYNDVYCKNLKSRWGSCSVRNNINLNIQLMRLSEELIDYVILHELCHTVHKNHSKRFWNKLDSVLPNSKIVDKKLRDHSTNSFSRI